MSLKHFLKALSLLYVENAMVVRVNDGRVVEQETVVRGLGGVLIQRMNVLRIYRSMGIVSRCSFTPSKFSLVYVELLQLRLVRCVHLGHRSVAVCTLLSLQ